MRVGTPLSPMLAASAVDLPTALGRTGPAAVEAKLDGVRIQVHRDGEDVAVYTRTLDEITDRLPEVVEAVRALPLRSTVLDGEVIALRADGRPEPFQVTAARAARHDSPDARRTPLTPVLFDVLHVDGEDLWDADRRRRREVLAALAPPWLLVPQRLVEDPRRTGPDRRRGGLLRRGAGRGPRGGGGQVVVQRPTRWADAAPSWVKVKPRHTLDLVVLAAEWGHGGAVGDGCRTCIWVPATRTASTARAGGFVMLGKTFKGLTDAMLTWQTERLQALAVGSDRWTVTVAPQPRRRGRLRRRPDLAPLPDRHGVAVRPSGGAPARQACRPGRHGRRRAGRPFGPRPG